ncbi:hypothetical protein ACHAXH_007810 [Discostella pseudostelligera]
MHRNVTFSLQQSSTRDDDDDKHRPAIKYALQHHRKYHAHPPPLLASTSTPTLLTTSTSTSPSMTHHQDRRQIPLPQQHQPTKYYHTTSKKEIIPFLIIGGFVGLSAVYTYKTFQQIDADWENYYKAVEEYKSKTGIDLEAEGKEDSAQQQSQMDAAATMGDGAATNTNLSTFFTGGILAIDVGTRRVKISHRPRPSSSSSSSASNTDQRTKSTPPTITVDREGYRYTPSIVWLPPPSSSLNDNGNDNEVLSGRLAEARLYDVKEGQTIPLQDIILDSGDHDGGDDQTTTNRTAISQSIRNVACNALDQVLGGGGSSSSSSRNKSKHPLFVLDESLSNLSGSYNVRPIFTYPTTPKTTDGTQSSYLEQYQKATSDLTSSVGIASYVSEPIAIVTGAEYFNLLPPMDTTSATSLGNNNSVLVIDVGGITTCISLVHGGDQGEKEILYSTSLPLGGDTCIDLLVSHLVDDFYGQQGNDQDEDDSSTAEGNTLSTRPKHNDPTALQRLHEASTTAMHELSNKTRSEINVPYLTMDMATRQPRHLKLGMSRNVLNGEVESWIRNKLVPYLMTKQQNNPSMTVLSQATPPPTNLASLFSSTIMCALEQTSHTPFMLRAILVVGGGARIPLVREAMKGGVGYLAGEAYAIGSSGKGKRLIMPEGEMCDELGVLGAAVWGSSR